MISDVKTYARTLMRGLSYVEWTDGFNFEDIPNTLLNSRFHVELGDASSKSINNDNDEILMPLTVRSFLQATGDPKKLIDQGALKGDTIITSFLKASNRTLQTGIKNVLFRSMKVLPLASSNDNGVIIEVRFDVLVIVSTI